MHDASDHNSRPVRTLSRGYQGAVLRVLRADDHEIRIVDRLLLTANILRLTFESTTLLAAHQPFASFWVRLWFPDPSGDGRAHQRAYTIVGAEPDAGRFALEFLLHDPAGPASAWAKRAEVGEGLIATVYGSRPVSAGAARRLLVADLAAWPAARELAEQIRADGAEVRTVVALLPGERAAAAAVIDGADPTVQWVEDDTRGDMVAAAVAAHAAWADDVWLAGEAGRLKAVRRALKASGGPGKKEITASAYWISGRSMGRIGEAVDDELRDTRS
ncbi:hypothetical protein BJH93_12340 [Kocuria polaris]|nr:hypothetical protein [Kocuria polaris]